MQDITPQRSTDRVGSLFFAGAAGLLAVVLAGIALGLLDARTPLLQQFMDAFR